MAAVAPDRALVFIGFMGAGKSAAAREAAASVGVRALDTDRMLEERLGCTVQEAFDRFGEAGFREHEQRLCVELLERARAGDVISLGGGAVLSEATRAALARHTAVLIDVDVETAWSRASGRGRPLARDRAAFERLYATRESLYLALADAILPGRERGTARRATPWLLELGEGVRLLWATARSASYPVLIGRRALEVRPWPARGRRFVISDETVGGRHGARIGSPAARLTMAPGEEHKTLATFERLQRELTRAGAGRGDHVVALGGGVVGDVAGFCAATYQRGIPVVQVPTTLVAQVDSAYGGKTGVDLPEGKNYVGAYHQPAGVLVDVGLLETLPEAELAAGRAEVVKTALIAGGRLWERVAAGHFDDEETVLDCARTKLAVVAADERDGGRRQILNLGHTIGHALETATGYGTLRHGEAVGLGLLAALRLSGLGDLRGQVRELLLRAGLPVALPAGVDRVAVLEVMQRDKKRVGDTVPFVLVRGPGDVRHGQVVEPDVVRAAVEELAV
ncbi:bifunctional shikimate kinase/3-dehydroquinate synthase [Capillimicrobium parvum]|uniref:Shikimate kinase n=1 Tax=Capillimicrobium parvum TaxID=2884022 RepID=A0A9E7C200_9ACTN|nr:bifunctional shikimate kinase/3-dehydroquinate synthase [Capillimicrobium parvum]UGS37122.1 3-dehydroquinate synthase [Capillimicrobium parvum]